MITITKTEIDVKDIRELAAAYRDIAEGYGKSAINGYPSDIFCDSAAGLLKFIDVKIMDNEQTGNGVPVCASTDVS